MMGRLLAGLLGACLAVGSLGISVPSPASGDGSPYGSSSDNTMARCPAGTVDCPFSDAFYRAPPNLAALKNGTVIGVRPATIAEPGISPKAAYTISYRSEDSFDHPVMDVATVLLPSSPYKGPGARPLVSLQFAIDSLGAQCAPSYSLAHPGTNTGIDVVADAWLSEMLANGYVVVASDFEGPAEQFIVGQQEGHAVLDGIRAAESLPAAGLSSQTRVVLTGYSGGADATGWASELAADYAPRLDVIGAAEGGTPASIAAVANYLNGTGNFGYDVFGVEAMARAFPAENIPSYLNAAGKQIFSAVSTLCVSSLDSNSSSNSGSSSASSTDYKTFNDYTTKPNLIEQPKFQALMAHESLGQSAPRFPVLNYQAYNDEIIPFKQDIDLVHYYCSKQVPADFVLLQGEHETGVGEGTPLMFSFLQDRFDSVNPTDDCATTVPAVSQLPQPPPITTGGPSSGGSTSGPRARPCRSSDRMLMFVQHPKQGVRVVRAVAFLNGKVARRYKGRSIHEISLARPKQTAFTLRIVATLSDGEQVSRTIRYDGCKASKPSVKVVHRARHRR